MNSFLVMPKIMPSREIVDFLCNWQSQFLFFSFHGPLRQIITMKAHFAYMLITYVWQIFFNASFLSLQILKFQVRYRNHNLQARHRLSSMLISSHHTELFKNFRINSNKFNKFISNHIHFSPNIGSRQHYYMGSWVERTFHKHHIIEVTALRARVSIERCYTSLKDFLRIVGMFIRNFH